MWTDQKNDILKWDYWECLLYSLILLYTVHIWYIELTWQEPTWNQKRREKNWICTNRDFLRTYQLKPTWHEPKINLCFNLTLTWIKLNQNLTWTSPQLPEFWSWLSWKNTAALQGHLPGHLTKMASIVNLTDQNLNRNKLRLNWQYPANPNRCTAST